MSKKKKKTNRKEKIIQSTRKKNSKIFKFTIFKCKKKSVPVKQNQDAIKGTFRKQTKHSN